MKKILTDIWSSMSGKEKSLAAVVLILFLFLFYVTLDANKYSALVNVIDGSGKVGVNPLPDNLDFGDLSRGTSAVRRVDLKNGTPIPVYVMVFKLGGISELVSINKNFFKLTGGDEEKIDFTAYIPASAEQKHYSGRVFIFKVPTFF